MAGYGDEVGFTAYAEAAGYVFPDGTTDAQKAAARQRGALVIDRYEPRFSGRRTGGPGTTALYATVCPLGEMAG